MKIRFILFFYLSICAILDAKAEGITCKLHGTTVNRNSRALLLVKATGELRGTSILIPIVNNHFDYTLETDQVEAYELVFEDEQQNGTSVSTYFFPDSKEVDFTLYPMEVAYEKNIVKGGFLNSAYTTYKLEMLTRFEPRFEIISKKRKELADQKGYYSAAYDSLMALILTTKDFDIKRPLYLKRNEMQKTGEDLTANGKVVRAEQVKIENDRNEWRFAYIRSNPTIVSYFLLLQETYYRAREDEMTGNFVKEAYPFFAAAFPEHVYTKRLANEVAGLNLRKPGQLYVDFTAPDISGKNHTFSQLLNGKVTLLDLWGSWCGPCIAASRTMVPVYNDFRDKGFQVIGVAREFKTIDGLKTALKREKYPWLNMVDLDDRQEVWSKYNISNSGGGIFLFDKDGKILAVDPTAEEVRKILAVRLQ